MPGIAQERMPAQSGIFRPALAVCMRQPNAGEQKIGRRGYALSCFAIYKRFFALAFRIIQREKR